ncbi:hypothetical protein B7463_g5415, partial [Scytalidium lignicola]
MTNFTKNGLDFEIIIVDNSSPDGTAEVAKQLQEAFPGRIIFKQRAGKLGLGTAYIYGRKLCQKVQIYGVDVLAKPRGYTVAEVPISFIDQIHGESKLGGDEIVQHAKEVLSLWARV